MKHLSSIIGFSMIGIFGMSIWGFLYSKVGVMGGWLSGVLIIGIFWFMNHFLGLVTNEGAWVDIGLALGIAGMTRDTLLFGTTELANSMPTLFWLAIGSILGGLVSAIIQKNLINKKNENFIEKEVI